MGNNYTKVINQNQEKSLYSYDVQMIDIQHSGDFNTKFISSLMNNTKVYFIDCKLKLYPSQLTIKNDNIRFDIDYYDIPGWGYFKNIWFCKTKNRNFFLKLNKKLPPSIISNDIKKVCQNILNENNRSLLE